MLRCHVLPRHATEGDVVCVCGYMRRSTRAAESSCRKSACAFQEGERTSKDKGSALAPIISRLPRSLAGPPGGAVRSRLTPHVCRTGSIPCSSTRDCSLECASRKIGLEFSQLPRGFVGWGGHPCLRNRAGVARGENPPCARGLPTPPVQPPARPLRGRHRPTRAASRRRGRALRRCAATLLRSKGSYG